MLQEMRQSSVLVLGNGPCVCWSRMYTWSPDIIRRRQTILIAGSHSVHPNSEQRGERSLGAGRCLLDARPCIRRASARSLLMEATAPASCFSEPDFRPSHLPLEFGAERCHLPVFSNPEFSFQDIIGIGIVIVCTFSGPR